jgi:hypothetical protein
MALKNDYQRVAARSLDACDATLNAGIQEKAAFLAYHAFESTGCALAKHMGLPVGARIAHAKKIKNFTDAARTLGNEKAVAALSVTLTGLRNSFLYPVENFTTGGHDLPESKITQAQAKELRKRVGGIVKWVGKAL